MSRSKAPQHRAGDWFRQPAGVLNCAATDAEAALFAARGWKPVTEAAAKKEIASGAQAKVAAQVKADAGAVDEQVRRAQDAAAAAAKQAAARKLVESSGLAVAPPTPGPAPSAAGDKVADEEKQS
ncbi:MAG TPA: hypothetical protein VFV01_47710 [Spirillospora sp.]|nr:hypothetical protein [Spirillospora sp.]